MKRKINLIVLLVFVVANIITPFSYAGLEGVDENSEVLLESLDEVSATSGEFDISENAENSLSMNNEIKLDNENLDSESDLVNDDGQENVEESETLLVESMKSLFTRNLQQPTQQTLSEVDDELENEETPALSLRSGEESYDITYTLSGESYGANKLVNYIDVNGDIIPLLDRNLGAENIGDSGYKLERGSINEESAQGPCPDGYHVPTINEWSSFIVAWCSDEGNNCNIKQLNQQENRSDDLKYSRNIDGRIGDTDVIDEFSEVLPYLPKGEGGRNDQTNYMVSSIVIDDNHNSNMEYLDGNQPPEPEGQNRSLYFSKRFNRIGMEETPEEDYRVRCIADDYEAPVLMAIDIFMGDDEIDTEMIMENEDWVLRTFVDKSSVSSDDIEEILSELSESVEERKAYQREWVLDNGEKLDYDLLNLENINDLKIYGYYAPVPFIEYESGNITYVDTNGRVFSGIGTITITSGSDSITILDRNLGATEVFNNDFDNPNSESYGYHFQRGNNYGFAPVENNSSDFAGDEMAINGTAEGYADTTENAWNNPYVSDIFIKTENMQDNPDGGWDTYNNDLWGGADDLFNELGDSTSDYKRQGPCPEGYHVPSARDFNKLIEMYHALSGDGVELWDSGYGYQIQSDYDARDFMFGFINTFKIPFAGYRSLGDATVYEMMDSIDNSYDPYTDSYNDPSIYLWTSSASLSQSWALTFYPYYDWLSLEMMQDRGRGSSVRCFKDSPLENGSESLVLQYETNGGSAIQAQTIPEGENAYLPGYTTHKDGATLIGWFNEYGSKKYSIGENGSALDLSMSSTSADENGRIKIYARWGHEVTFLDWDGTELAVLPVAEGETAEYSGTPTREGYIFSGWDVDISNVVSDIVATAQYKTAYVITWKDGDGNILKTVPVAEGDIPVYDGKTPTKSSSGNYKYTFNGRWLPELTGTFEETDYVAQFDEKLINNNGYSGGGGSGGGGGSSTSVKDDDSKDASDTSKSDENKDNSDENKNDSDETPAESSNENKDVVPAGITEENSTDKNNNGNHVTYSQEFVDAYSFAKENRITTTSSIEDAKMYGNLTRIQMAKMLSQFSINVLGNKPDTTLNNKFNDVSEYLDKQYDDGVTLSFQLGIMGQNMPNNKFRPNDEVSRAEFVAAFSRMLYGTSDGEYRSTRNYYKPHMSKLYNEGIVSDTNPNMKERRGYVMIMLMRSIKSN